MPSVRRASDTAHHPLVELSVSEFFARPGSSCARILYMATFSVADARANFSKLVESAATTHERFEVTRNGSRAVVMMGADDYDTMVETIEILSDAAAVEAIRVGLAEIGAGEVVDEGDVRAAMIAAGRLAR